MRVQQRCADRHAEHKKEHHDYQPLFFFDRGASSLQGLYRSLRFRAVDGIDAVRRAKLSLNIRDHDRRVHETLNPLQARVDDLEPVTRGDRLGFNNDVAVEVGASTSSSR